MNARLAGTEPAMLTAEERVLLRSIRAANGLSQRGMAQRLVMNEANYRRIEVGQRPVRAQFWLHVMRTFSIPKAEAPCAATRP